MNNYRGRGSTACRNTGENSVYYCEIGVREKRYGLAVCAIFALLGGNVCVLPTAPGRHHGMRGQRGKWVLKWFSRGRSDVSSEMMVLMVRQVTMNLDGFYRVLVTDRSTKPSADSATACIAYISSHFHTLKDQTQHSTSFAYRQYQHP